MSLEKLFSNTVATIESQVDRSEFKTIVAKFLSKISAPTALAYVNFFLKRWIWAGKSLFVIKKMFLNLVSIFRHPTRVLLSYKSMYIFYTSTTVPIMIQPKQLSHYLFSFSFSFLLIRKLVDT